MFDKFKEIKGQMKMLKDLQSKLGDVDMSNPQAMLESMGIDVDDLQKQFDSQSESIIDTKVPLRFINESENKNPEYAYQSDSGFDLRSTEEVWIHSNDRKIIPTGLRFDISEGYEIQVRSKSGLALNQGLMVLNSPGTVDSGYQGEIKVIMFNTTNQKVKIEKGQKVAQAVLCPVVSGKWVDLIKVEKINDKDRNDNGFGSTGL
jgi:dUTP pyrophosphatase